MKMLDADTCIYCMRGDPAVLSRMRSHAPSSLHVSAIVAAELHKGPHAGQPEVLARRLHRVRVFLSTITEVPFDADDAAVAGSILGRMQLAGRQIGSIDSLIAGHALSRGFALVTNNTKHYERIAGLQLFNWV